MISRGDEHAFHLLFDAYQKKLFSYIFRITESREMAQDTVQDIFLKIWSVRAKLPGIDNISAYLHRMARNYAHDGFKKLAKEALVLSELKRQYAETNHPGQQLVSKEVREYILRLIDQLTPQQRKIYLLSREDGLKHEEIARQLNISVSTVKKHMQDALRFLRGEISSSYGAEATAVFIIFCLATY